MKVAVYVHTLDSTSLKFARVLSGGYHPDFRPDYTFVGFVDYAVELPKKLVTKEAEQISWMDASPNVRKTVCFVMPKDAKNVKCTYEIEE